MDTSRRIGPQLVLLQCLTLESPGQGLQRCQAWACDRVVRRWWCLVGLQSCLTFSRGAVAGPFVRGCETESRQTLYLGVCPRLLYLLSVLWKYGYKFEMDDRRDWGGGGDDPEESTQRMIERIWESLTDIRVRMDQRAPVPPVAVPPRDEETVPVAPVPPGVELYLEVCPRLLYLLSVLWKYGYVTCEI
ncbi:hypothetical protein Taro_017831 [Colocasia esculenta]|uniref:Uncharacterized protein n=1 Tax=Colocasia esculenta TaxID=4460 RepID=A0A843UH68_COLES|nr:hypothetical protein [Colocasia esculenta]